MVTVGATGRLFRNAGMSARGTRQNRREKGNQAAIAGVSGHWATRASLARHKGRSKALGLIASGGVAESLAEAKAAFRAAWDAPEMKKPRGVLRNESSQSEAHTEIPLCAPVRLV